MRVHRAVSLLFAAALGVATSAGLGCRKDKGPGEDPGAVAVVNGEVLARTEFEAALRRELASSEGVGPEAPEQVDPYKRALLKTLIERTLLLQAAREANITVSPEEVDRDVLRMSSDYPAAGFEEALARNQLSMAELKQQTAAKLTIEKLYQNQVYPRVAVTEDELRAYFKQHEARYHEPEKVRAQQIVVKGLDEARRIQAQLRQGKRFAELARKYSLSADAKVGGDLGFFAKGEMPPEFDAVAFSLGVGEVSDVVSTEYGYHLFKVTGKKPPRRKELGDIRAQVELALLEEKRAQAQVDYLKDLTDKAKIQINEGVLVSIQPRPKDAPVAKQ